MTQYVADNLSGMTKLDVPKDSPASIGPGYYPDGIKWPSGNLTLSPGVYILGGDGLSFNGVNFVADGVFLYLLPGKKNKTAVTLTGSGIVRITPIIDEILPYSGVAIYQDVHNENSATINGARPDALGGNAVFARSASDNRGYVGHVRQPDYRQDGGTRRNRHRQDRL